MAAATDFVPTLAEYAPSEPGIVGTVLSGILDQVAMDKDLRRRYVCRCYDTWETTMGFAFVKNVCDIVQIP